jgi:hypothetical protein
MIKAAEFICRDPDGEEDMKHGPLAQPQTAARSD